MFKGCKFTIQLLNLFHHGKIQFYIKQVQEVTDHGWLQAN
jgi:hypothetical protein